MQADEKCPEYQVLVPIFDDLKSTKTFYVWVVFRNNGYSGVFCYDENANFTMNSIEFSGHII